MGSGIPDVRRRPNRGTRRLVLFVGLLLASSFTGCFGGGDGDAATSMRGEGGHGNGATSLEDEGDGVPEDSDGEAGDASTGAGNTTDDKGNAAGSTNSTTEDAPPDPDDGSRDDPEADPSGGNASDGSDGSDFGKGDGDAPKSPRAVNEWRIGDSWTYRVDGQKDSATSVTTVINVTSAHYVIRYVQTQNDVPIANETRRIAKANLTWEHANNQVLFFPFAVGDERTFSRADWTSRVEVRALDEVEMEAGTFQAYRFLQNTTHPSGDPIRIDYWFAPEVHNLVLWRLVSTGTLVRLIDYRLAE